MMEENIVNTIDSSTISLPVTSAPKKNYWIPILGSLLVVSLISLAFLYSQIRVLQAELVNKPNPSSYPIATTDPTANWKTYIHPTHKYEFKHPTTWSVTVSKYASTNVFFGIDASSMTGVGGVEIRELNGDPQKYHSLNGEEIANQQLITLPSGISGYKSEIVSSPMGNDFVFKSEDGLIYHLFIESTDPQDLQIFDQILSTFKFRDQNSTIPQLKTPLENAIVTSPLIIAGTVPSGWMFEGQFQIEIRDLTGNILGRGIAKEDIPGSWAREEFVAFTSTINFTAKGNSGAIVLLSDNPSGNPKQQQNYNLSVKFSP